MLRTWYRTIREERNTKTKGCFIERKHLRELAGSKSPETKKPTLGFGECRHPCGGPCIASDVRSSATTFGYGRPTLRQKTEVKSKRQKTLVFKNGVECIRTGLCMLKKLEHSIGRLFFLSLSASVFEGAIKIKNENTFVRYRQTLLANLKPF